MKIITASILLFASALAWGQVVPVVRDANGVEIGFPLRISRMAPDDFYWELPILRADSIVTLVTENGSLGFGLSYFFESADCTGTAYFNNESIYGYSPQIRPEEVGPAPHQLYLIPTVRVSEEIIVSSILGEQGCRTRTPFTTEAILVADQLKIDDPAAYGLTLLPDVNEWGYPVPLTIEAAKPEVISCSGFESCPTK